MWNPNFRYRAASSFSDPFPGKRKLSREVTEFELPPPKMLITEEKMVSQLNGIHLSSDYTSHGTTRQSDFDTSLRDSFCLSGKKGSRPSLVLCDELRELQKKAEPIIPKAIFDKFHQPTTALVLWQPPAGELGFLKSVVANSSSKSTEEEDEVSSSQPPNPPPVNEIVDVDMAEDDNNNGSLNFNLNAPLLR